MIINNERIKSFMIGGVAFCAEYIESELATEITIEGETMLWISWDDVDKFAEEMNKVVKKYMQ